MKLTHLQCPQGHGVNVASARPDQLGTQYKMLSQKMKTRLDVIALGRGNRAEAGGYL